MRTYTLDTNCLIALEKAEPTADSLRQLIAWHRDRRIELAVPAIAASERQVDGKYLENFGQFQDRLARLGLSGVQLIEPIAYYGISFYGHGYWADDTMEALERQIQSVLHPNVEFTLAEFCNARGIPVDTEVPAAKWRNAKCDVQAMWSHVWHKRDVFVSSDRHFLKQTKMSQLKALGAGAILNPVAAVAATE